MSWPLRLIGEFLTESAVESTSPSAERRIRVKLNAEGVEKRPLLAETEGATKYFIRRSRQFIYGKQNLHKGAFGIVAPELDGFESSGDLPAFDVAEGLRPEWLVYYLKQGGFYRSLVSVARGAATKRIQPKDLFAVRIPVPALGIQDALIERMHLATAMCGSAEQEIAHQENLVAKLKQAVLQEAITGRLTAGWRAAQSDVEPASQLLARIRAEKARLVAAKKLRPEKPLPAILDSEIPFAIPEGWEWCRLGQSGILKRGKSKHRPRNDERMFANGTVPFVQTGDVAQSKHTGFLIGTYSSQYNDFGVAQSQLWPAGTMCITIAANIAETGFLTIPACVPDSVVTYTSPAGADAPKYVRMFIELTRTMIEKFAPATAQKNINLEILNELMLPLPPLREQTEIVARVEGLMERCRELEAEITRSRAHAAALLQAVLRETFAPATASA